MATTFSQNAFVTILEHMKQERLMAMVDDTAHQVFIMATPISLPLTMFVHTYIVTNVHGTLTRWDVLHRPAVTPDSRMYVHRNITQPWRGLGYLYVGRVFSSRRAFVPHCLGSVQEQTHGDLPRQMIAFLQREAFHYPAREFYRYLGPNSNTFVQWFLDQFDGHGIILPRRALGKHYTKKLCLIE